LLNAVNVVLQRFSKREDPGAIYEDKWSVSEKIEFILRVIAERGSLRFAELFESAANRSEVICTFLALLELIRLRQLVCSQPEPFGEIEIRAAVAAGVPPAVEGGILPPGNAPPSGPQELWLKICRARRPAHRQTRRPPLQVRVNRKSKIVNHKWNSNSFSNRCCSPRKNR